MNPLIHFLPRELPAFGRKMILKRLFSATAAGFERPMPRLARLSLPGCLQAYARFTREQAARSLKDKGDAAGAKSRLYSQARQLGSAVRRWFHPASLMEVMLLGQVLYRAIGVDLKGDEAGRILVTRCTYSQYYSPAVCDLISALDDGVWAGLAGGGRLVFSQRITEGCPYCTARLLFNEETQA